MNPSRSIPEGVETVSAEGSDLARAVATAAESIGIEPNRVEFKFDMSHFRSTTGSSVAKRTVKIIAWNTTKTDEELAAEAEKQAKARKPRRDDDRGDRGDRRERKGRGRDRDDRKGRGRDRDRDRDDRDDRDEAEAAPAEPAEPLEDTEASTFAREWFTQLLGHMSIEGEVKSGGNDERVQLYVSSQNNGRLIGKRGSTLGAIRHLLGLAVTQKFGDLTIDVDVEDNRPDRGDRKPKRDRNRRDRGGKRDRGDRGDRGDRERSRYPEAKLRALAARAAEKAREEQKVITINLELNSYDRRIVHLEVAEIDGVESRSEERDDGVKIIQVAPIGE